MMLTSQNEAGHSLPDLNDVLGGCGVNAQNQSWLPNGSRGSFSTYDPSFAPAQEKSGVLLGMGMTESRRLRRPRQYYAR